MDDAWRTIHNPAINDTVHFLTTAEESGGEVTRATIHLAPGGRNALHSHGSYTESFTVLEGNLGIQIGRRKRTLSVGEQATVPQRTPHRFFNPTGHEAVFRVEVRPGHSGFEQTLRILYGLAGDAQTNRQGLPKNPLFIGVLAEMSDMKPAGLAAVMNPLLGVFARRGHAKHLDRELIARYCTPPQT